MRDNLGRLLNFDSVKYIYELIFSDSFLIITCLPKQIVNYIK